MKIKKKYFVKYSLEFLVIFLGISISLYVEKESAINYKQTLKNQSLNRINNNIKVDINDMEYNYKTHSMASKSIDWIINNNSKLLSKSKDSIGIHISNAILLGTIFVDNQEEYRALRNSGLIELIELEDVVFALQNKYSSHEFYKQIESEILSKNKLLVDFLYKNTILENESLNEVGFPSGRIFTGNEKISQSTIERLKDKKFFHEFYKKRIKVRIKKDRELIELINNEI
jgi:hypothetical protein